MPGGLEEATVPVGVESVEVLGVVSRLGLPILRPGRRPEDREPKGPVIRLAARGGSELDRSPRRLGLEERDLATEVLVERPVPHLDPGEGAADGGQEEELARIGPLGHDLRALVERQDEVDLVADLGPGGRDPAQRHIRAGREVRRLGPIEPLRDAERDEDGRRRDPRPLRRPAQAREAGLLDVRRGAGDLAEPLALGAAPRRARRDLDRDRIPGGHGRRLRPQALGEARLEVPGDLRRLPRPHRALDLLEPG